MTFPSDWYLRELYIFRQRGKLHQALEKGVIAKPLKCQNCYRETKLEGHHPDHKNALDVLWLCHKCHMQYHGLIVHRITPENYPIKRRIKAGEQVTFPVEID